MTGPAVLGCDPVQALLSVLVMFRLLPCGFANRDLRELLAPLLSLPLGAMTAGRMTYDLRRLRLRGLIERIPGTHRYQVTDFGLRVALFFTRAHARLLRPGLGQALGPGPPQQPLRRAFDRLEAVMDDHAEQARLAA